MIATLRHQWSPTAHSKNLVLHQTLSRVSCSAKALPFFAIALTESHLNRKRNFFEIKIDSIDYKESILVGVANKQVDLEKDPVGAPGFWGLQPLM